MFLAKSRVAYFGKPEDAVEMLSRFGFTCPRNYNPADMIIEHLAVEPNNVEESLERIEKICTSFAESPEGKELQIKVDEAEKQVGVLPPLRKSTGFCTQV